MIKNIYICLHWIFRKTQEAYKRLQNYDPRKFATQEKTAEGAAAGAAAPAASASNSTEEEKK